ncbi:MULTISPECIES: helix-turn-helix transcriptional regulator [unclassified Myroides]|uniref:helix-turn-helix transcriptional regulator n=1 Tax=unclassified Myroides TaxID=2642485 RepID=UPI003D2F825F
MLVFSLCILGLHGIVYLSDVYERYFITANLEVVLFLFLGNGCMYFLKLKRYRWLLHGIPVFVFILFVLNQVTVWGTILAVSLVHETLFLSIGTLSFFYGCYGYCCLINNCLYKILRPYVVFYIVVLFCVSLSFFLLYFYAHLFLDYIDQLFYGSSLLLLIGAFVFEVKLFAFLRYQQAVDPALEREWMQQKHRLFGEVTLDVSLPQMEGGSSRLRPTQECIDLNHLKINDPCENLVQVMQENEIRQMITDQLIETRLFLNPSLNLEQLAVVLNLQKSELLRFFRASQSTTFKQYLNRLRVEYAILLIRDNEENFTVEELSLLCGFNTRLSFYRAFVDVFGFAPSEIMS